VESTVLQTKKKSFKQRLVHNDKEYGPIRVVIFIILVILILVIPYMVMTLNRVDSKTTILFKWQSLISSVLFIDVYWWQYFLLLPIYLVAMLAYITSKRVYINNSKREEEKNYFTLYNNNLIAQGCGCVFAYTVSLIFKFFSLDLNILLAIIYNVTYFYTLKVFFKESLINFFPEKSLVCYLLNIPPSLLIYKYILGLDSILLFFVISLVCQCAYKLGDPYIKIIPKDYPDFRHYYAVLSRFHHFLELILLAEISAMIPFILYLFAEPFLIKFYTIEEKNLLINIIDSIIVISILFYYSYVNCQVVIFLTPKFMKTFWYCVPSLIYSIVFALYIWLYGLYALKPIDLTSSISWFVICYVILVSNYSVCWIYIRNYCIDYEDNYDDFEDMY